MERNPIVKVPERGRLAYYGPEPDSAYWRKVWEPKLNVESYIDSCNGELGEIGQHILPWLPDRGRILEAGCGRGQVVIGLRNLGYNCEGVDLSRDTVDAVTTLWPAIPIRQGDVKSLAVPDGYYSAYISIGVIEHRQDGPEPFLCEAWRVLKPGGLAVFTVPYFNLLRQLKAGFGLYGGNKTGLHFYQYAFGRSELVDILQGAGFEVNQVSYYGLDYGLKTECPLYAWPRNRRYLGAFLRSVATKAGALLPFLDHMLLAVCHKKTRSRQIG